MIINIDKPLKKLKSMTGIDVAPNVYTGKAKKYIVFTLQSERPTFADNEEDYLTAEVMVKFVCPADYNFYNDANSIKDSLKALGFNVANISEYAEHTADGDWIKNVIFDTNIIEFVKEI